MILNGQLYRKSSDDLDDDADVALASQPRKFIMAEAAFEAIMREHQLVGPHGGVVPTWGSAQRSYYDIIKEEVRWVIQQCEVCARKRPSNEAAPLQPLVIKKRERALVCRLGEL